MTIDIEIENVTELGKPYRVDAAKFGAEESGKMLRSLFQPAAISKYGGACRRHSALNTLLAVDRHG